LSSKASLFVPSSAWAACEPHDSSKVSRQTISLLQGLPEEACNPSDSVARKTVSLVDGLPEGPLSVSLAQDIPESVNSEKAISLVDGLPEKTVSLMECLPEDPWTVSLAQGVSENTKADKTVSLVKGLPEGPWTVCLAQGILESTQAEDSLHGALQENPCKVNEPSECALRETVCQFDEPRSHVLQDPLCRSEPVKVHSISSFEKDLQNLPADGNEISQAPQYSREILLSLRCLCLAKDTNLNATGANMHTCRDRSVLIDDVRTPVVRGAPAPPGLELLHPELLQPELHDKALSAKAPTKSTMRTHLNNLAVADSGRVLTLRKLNRIGMNSSALLEAYFSRFGTVESVMVSHTFVKSMFAKGKKRERPATTGFLMMATAEDAEAVLRAGTDHEVQGAGITVHPFKSHSLDAAEVESDRLSVKSTDVESDSVKSTDIESDSSKFSDCCDSESVKSD